MWPLPPLPNDDAGSLLIAFSGGLDSTVLLHRAAHDATCRARGLRAVHVHHGLHADADAWAAHCERICAQWQIAFDVVRVSVSRDGGHGLEAAAREARYAACASVMRDGDVLVTAHHRDDQAETFLLRALRASGVDGLAAMQPWRSFSRGWHWRPLLESSRAQLMEYAQSHGLEWIDDPANGAEDFDRNFLRHHVLPMLRNRWPHADAAFARSALLAGEAADLLAGEDAHALARVATLDPQAIHVAALCRFPRERRARVMRRWLMDLGMPPFPAEGIACVEHDLLHARDDAHAEFRWQGAIVRRWRDVLHGGWIRAPLPDDFCVDWDTSRPLRLPTGDTLSMQGVAWPAALRVTARRGGERIRLPGRTHSHALKHLLQDAGIPPWERECLPLLWSDADELLAAGDLLIGAEMDAWLRANATGLCWQRADPASPAHPAR